ncbi:hypothetical protein CVT26_011922 [Gymnopilus dilepis]|uniref:Uncharacterized protein n=1 Tax=Gymnopilus dilepis TaxID=231916 RepID=A0A409WX79_9AGAR|nr:hypothetical protein CVT26_011922 [Gymnopilus dilepis]
MTEKPPEDKTLEICVDSEGYVTCPDCNEKKRCGTAGVENILKNHRGTKACIDAKAKKAKENKKLKDACILSFMQPKAKPVPSTVMVTPIAQSAMPNKPVECSTDQAKAIDAPDGAPHTKQSPFVQHLKNLSQSLPPQIPEGTKEDLLARFSNPAMHDDLTIKADSLWEDIINPFLKATLGWGVEGNLTDVIRRGELGFDAVVKYVEYFVEKREVDVALFEGKLTYLVEIIENMRRRDLPTNTFASPSLPSETSAPGPVDSDVEIVEVISPATREETQGSDDVQTLPKLRSKPVSRSQRCSGYALRLPGGRTPHGAYPFALHNILAIPWDYTVRNNAMSLISRACEGFCKDGQTCCMACRSLARNKTLEGILVRMEDGIPETTQYAYHGIDGLIQLLHRKSEQSEFHRLRGLNYTKSLLRKSTALDDHKRFLVAVASGNMMRVDRLISVALRQKKGIQATIKLLGDATEGVHKFKSYGEQDYDKGMVLLRLGGNRLAAFGNKALGLPSITALRNFSSIPPIIPSHARPSATEIEANIKASFEGIMDVVEGGGGNVYHAVLMFDEIATEKRIRLDRSEKFFLGVCRQHGQRTSLKFSCVEDMEELFRCLDQDEVHYASEATIGALGILCDNHRIYPARPILISGDCKKESGEEHANVLQTTLDAISNQSDFLNIRIVSIASDGEKRRGTALAKLTFKNLLSSESKIYGMLSCLVFMDLHVGSDDLTADKDCKHIIKRLRNFVIRPRGFLIGNERITPPLLQVQIESAGASSAHIRASFNPKDRQDVPLAFNTLKDIWTLPQVPSVSNYNDRPGFQNIRTALWVFGRFLYHLIFPYLCVYLSLSEQLEHLSAAAHLALALFREGGKDSLPTELYSDVMIMVKNVYFCVAKAKADHPTGSFWITLLGTDRLEELFGILRTMVGNDANVDMLQLTERLGGTTEVSNIFAKHPEWDRSPRRLKMPTLTRSSEDIPGQSDHLKPGTWKGDVRLDNVTLQTCWRRGRHLIENELPSYGKILSQSENEAGISILSPFGQLLVNVPRDEDDFEIEENFNEGSNLPEESRPSLLSSEAAELRVEVEDSLRLELDELEKDKLSPGVQANRFITFQGQKMTKVKALGLYSKYRKIPTSTDRLRRVQGVGRHVGLETGMGDVDTSDLSGSGTVLMVSDPIASLLRCEGHIWLCIGLVNGITNDGKSVPFLDLDLLGESKISVSYQLLGLRPSTSDDDPSMAHDWRTYSTAERTIAAPGCIVQPINPEISKPNSPGTPLFYLFDSRVLNAMSASIYEGLVRSNRKLIPKFGDRTAEYPYRERLGENITYPRKACFLAQNSADTYMNGNEDDELIACPLCTDPIIYFDPGQGQRMLQHIGSHILFDKKVARSDEPCGLCLRPSMICQHFLKKGRGARGKLTFDHDRTRTCPVKHSISYSVAVKSSDSSPCSNAPIICPLCSDKHDPAVWRYNMRAHFSRVHPTVTDLERYCHLWELTKFEQQEMKKTYDKRRHVPSKRKKASELAPLVISEAHRAQVVPILEEGREGSQSSDTELSGSEYDKNDLHEGGEEEGSETESGSELDIDTDRTPAADQGVDIDMRENDTNGGNTGAPDVVDNQGAELQRNGIQRTTAGILHFL